MTGGDLPEDWTCEFEETVHDEVMGEEYTRAKYVHDGGSVAVRIARVEDIKDFGGWGYQVRAEQVPGEGDADLVQRKLGIVEDLEGARERAREFMSDYEPVDG